MSQTPISSSKDELIARCIPFLEEVKNLTTGSEVEQWLNDKYGTDSELYQDLARLIRIGVEVEGWAADVEIAGRRYRRARLVELRKRPSDSVSRRFTWIVLGTIRPIRKAPSVAITTRTRMVNSTWWCRSMMARHSWARTAGVTAAGRPQHQEAITTRKPKAAQSLRSSSCLPAVLRITSRRPTQNSH